MNPCLPLMSSLAERIFPRWMKPTSSVSDTSLNHDSSLPSRTYLKPGQTPGRLSVAHRENGLWPRGEGGGKSYRGRSLTSSGQAWPSSSTACGQSSSCHHALEQGTKSRSCRADRARTLRVQRIVEGGGEAGGVSPAGATGHGNNITMGTPVAVHRLVAHAGACQTADAPMVFTGPPRAPMLSPESLDTRSRKT